MKFKVVHLLILLFISSHSFSQEDSDSKWKNSGNAIFLVNQSSFSNWTSGGQSSISGTLKIDYNFNYADNGWDWDTKLISNFGLNKISGSEFLKKTDDRIEVNSVLGKNSIMMLLENGVILVFSIFKLNLQKATGLEKIQMGTLIEPKNQDFFLLQLYS